MMIYQCYSCSRTTFETSCPWCSPDVSGTFRQMTPLDPSYYPDFQYQSKGIIKDLFGKKKEQSQLNALLENVLLKYATLKDPYFTNFTHQDFRITIRIATVT